MNTAATLTPCGTLTSRVVNTKAEATAFAAAYAERSGHPSDAGYLRQSHVRAFYDRSGQVRGGYALATQDHRYLAAIPGDACPLPVEACCEVTHIWIDRSVATLDRVRLYGWALLDVLGSGRRYVLGGSTVAKVAKVQQQGLPYVIFRGEVVIEEQTHQAQVYYGTRWSVVRGFVVGAVQRLCRRSAKRLALRHP